MPDDAPGSSLVPSGSDREGYLTPGARQGQLDLPSQGGGYRNVCTDLNFAVGAMAAAADPRLVELKRMGLPRIWHRVADHLGFDTFMRVWWALANDPGVVRDNQRVCVPLFSRYHRYQRNQLIRSLSAAGRSLKAIQRDVRRATGRGVSATVIRTVLKSA